MKTAALAALSKAYQLGQRFDRALKREVKLPVPVVSVGNIALGGRAKTPFVVEIARGLKTRGFEPVVLSRGYGRKGRQALWLERELLSSDEIGDEPLEIHLLCGAPVLVGSDRAANAFRWLTERPARKTVFLLDDGFQHWKLARNFDLVLVRGEDHSGQVVPWGQLREPPSSLSRASLVLEEGNDFLKRTSMPIDAGEQVAVITTRAQAVDRRLFSEFRDIVFVEERDHAPRSRLMSRLKAIEPGRVLLVGGKEAVKLLEGERLRSLFVQGRVKALVAGHERELRLSRLELEIRDAAGFWNRMMKAISQ